MRLLCVMCVAAMAAHAQAENPFAGDAASVAAGRALYDANCASCHGGDGRNGRAPDLLGAERFRAGEKDSDLFAVISKGVAGSDMPAWSGELTADEVWRVVAFLRAPHAKNGPPLGNGANGEAIFWGRGHCADCHAVGRKGNRIGPDLSAVGRQRSSSFLLESLTREGPSLLPAYEGVTVETRDGRSITGIVKALDDFSVVFTDFKGQVYSFDRAALKSVTRRKRSLMPSYAKELTDSERNDLVAWLQQLEGSGK